MCLNRTFYGIETSFRQVSANQVECLNRTFYGIETTSYNLEQEASEGS